MPKDQLKRLNANIFSQFYKKKKNTCAQFFNVFFARDLLRQQFLLSLNYSDMEAPRSEKKDFYKNQDFVKALNEKQIGILNEAKAMLLEDSIALPDEILAWYVTSKKTAEKVVIAAKQYIYWIAVIDFETIPWEYFEELVRTEFFIIPTNPFTLSNEGATCVFLNSYNLDPKSHGGRLLTGFLWVQIHFLLSKSNLCTTGLCTTMQMGGISYSKFYPQIDRPLTNSLQSVLPVRVKKINIIDAPFIFWTIWEIIKLWLNSKFVARVNFVSSKQAAEIVPREKSPSFVGGSLEYDINDYVVQLKDFYENEFRDSISSFVKDMPKEIFNSDMWEIPHDFMESLSKKKKKAAKKKASKK